MYGSVTGSKYRKGRTRETRCLGLHARWPGLGEGVTNHLALVIYVLSCTYRAQCQSRMDIVKIFRYVPLVIVTAEMDRISSGSTKLSQGHRAKVAGRKRDNLPVVDEEMHIRGHKIGLDRA